MHYILQQIFFGIWIFSCFIAKFTKIWGKTFTSVIHQLLLRSLALKLEHWPSRYPANWAKKISGEIQVFTGNFVKFSLSFGRVWGMPPPTHFIFIIKLFYHFELFYHYQTSDYNSMFLLPSLWYSFFLLWYTCTVMLLRLLSLEKF